jgi:hypothetical protein
MMKSVTVTDLQKVLINNNVVTRIYSKIKDFVGKLQVDKKAQFIIAVILFANLFFIAMHGFILLARYLGLFDDFISTHLSSPRFRIDRDWSFAEWFNYLQTTTCAVLLLGVFRATRQPLYVAWALIFLFVVMDDSLKIHEGMASYLVGTFGVPALPGLRPHESGELIAWSVIGSVLVGILWWSIARSGRGARAAGGVLALAFAALIFFGIGIDMAHIAFTQTGTGLYALLGVLEDGGEMLSIALALALALLLYRHPAIAG